MPEIIKNRAFIRLEGKDALNFLHTLTTNDLSQSNKIVYTAILTPNGRYNLIFSL